MTTAPPQARVLTPAGFAYRASAGQWQCPPHLSLMNRKACLLAARRVKRMITTLPPRHGKSVFMSQYFPAWYLGTFSSHRVILASYEAEFAASWGGKAQAVLRDTGPAFFGVEVSSKTAAASRWNVRKAGDPAGNFRAGGMDTAGVGGAITGKGADLLLIDDPVKNSEEALSQVYRDKAWDWFQSTAYTRLAPGGVVGLTMTRWHSDDLAGRLIAASEAGEIEPWEVVNLPALAEENDPLGRTPGEALWPERFPVAELEKIRDTVGEYYWSAMFQQRPVPRGGGMFQEAWFGEANQVSGPPEDVAARLRAWDKAASHGKGDYTVGVLMSLDRKGYYTVEHVVRGRWSEGERDRVIEHTAREDADRFGCDTIRFEIEPGSSGLDAAAAFVRNLAGYDVKGIKSTGDKESRARPLASQCEFSNVRLVRGEWNRAYVAEMTGFPRGAHDDQVDASSLAFNCLAGKGSDAPPVVGGRRQGYDPNSFG